MIREIQSLLGDESETLLTYTCKGFPRPMEDGIQLVNAIQDVYLCSEVTVA